MSFPHFRYGPLAMNMNRYTNTELADIHFMYGLANGNGRVDVRWYGSRYPVALNILPYVGSQAVRAPDSGPKGLGSMPIPPITLRVHTQYVLVKSVGPKVLWAESRVQGTGENLPPLQFHA
ncbi:uncharacterized protein TNCV_1351021 [Trichonephila clavipes]|nr:uncharacterized protein TNCV_1351021 [Trichonephila clavipes]